MVLGFPFLSYQIRAWVFPFSVQSLRNPRSWITPFYVDEFRVLPFPVYQINQSVFLLSVWNLKEKEINGS